MSTQSEVDDKVWTLARFLHRQYLDIATDQGWEVQDGTATDFNEIPETNRDVMLGLARRLIEEYEVDP